MAKVITADALPKGSEGQSINFRITDTRDFENYNTKFITLPWTGEFEIIDFSSDTSSIAINLAAFNQSSLRYFSLETDYMSAPIYVSDWHDGVIFGDFAVNTAYVSESNNNYIGFGNAGGSAFITGGAANHSIVGGTSSDFLTISEGTGEHRFEGGAGNDNLVLDGFSSGEVDFADFSAEEDVISTSISDATYQRNGEEIIVSDGDKSITIDVNTDASEVEVVGATLVESAPAEEETSPAVVTEEAVDEAETSTEEVDISQFDVVILDAKRDNTSLSYTDRSYVEFGDTGGSATSYGGSANHRIIGKSGLNNFDVAGGSGSHAFIGGTGTDIFSISGGSGSHSFEGGQGDDRFNVWGASGDHSFEGGQGSDRLTFFSRIENGSINWTDFSSEQDIIYSVVGGATYKQIGEKLILTDGENEFTINLNTDARGIAIIGAELIETAPPVVEDETIVINSDSTQYSVESGQGNDTLVFNGGSEGRNINASGGDDVLTFNDTHGTHNVSGGEGNDLFTFNNSSVYGIHGDSGNDSFVFNSVSGKGRIYGGDGDDSFTFNEYYGSYRVYGGDGDDVITVNSGPGSDGLKITGGKGDDTFILNEARSGRYFFDGGEGVDTLHIEKFQGRNGKIDIKGFEEGIDIISTSIEGATYERSGRGIIFNDGENRIRIDLNQWHDAKVEGATRVIDSNWGFIRFDSDDIASDGMWNLARDEDILYDMRSKFTLAWRDSLDNFDSRFDFSQAHADGRFSTSQVDGNLVLGFANADIILDRNQDFDADTDSSGDISFNEFVDALGTSSLDFS